ncbi:Fc.00g038630.m01.CDS01 [Cosmosporella sp. VM-42]
MTSRSNTDGLGANSLFNVSNLIALVTGGGSGIGLMMAKALARNGATKVYIAGRRLDVLQAAAVSVGPNVIPVRCDVTCKTSLEEVVAFIEKEVGYLNLLVCNSGIGGPQVKPISQDTTVEQWASDNFAVEYDQYVNTFSVNAAAVWYTSMAFLRLLDLGNKKGNLQQSSQIIVTGSIAGFNKKAPGGWAYGQSKAAATLAVKQLAVALPQWNIR